MIDKSRVFKGIAGGALAASLLVAGGLSAAAQDVFPDVAAAGNGGIATSGADGGAVAGGNVNSGANSGNSVAVGNSGAPVEVDGGASASGTSADIWTDGATGIADASGGSPNLATV